MMLSKPVQATSAVGFTPWLFQCAAADAAEKRTVSAAAVIGWFKAGMQPHRFARGAAKPKTKAGRPLGGGGSGSGNGGSMHNNFLSLEFPHISKRTLELLVLRHTGIDRGAAKLAKRRLLTYLPEKEQRRVRGGWDGQKTCRLQICDRCPISLGWRGAAQEGSPGRAQRGNIGNGRWRVFLQ
jgi:hypothetical protein